MQGSDTKEGEGSGKARSGNSGYQGVKEYGLEKRACLGTGDPANLSVTLEGAIGGGNCETELGLQITLTKKAN
jgi:hypothetical protein